MRVGLFLRTGSLLAAALIFVVSALAGQPLQQTLRYWHPGNAKGMSLAFLELTDSVLTSHVAALMKAYHANGAAVVTLQLMGDGTLLVKGYRHGPEADLELSTTLEDFRHGPIDFAKRIKAWLTATPEAPPPESSNEPPTGMTLEERQAEWAGEFLSGNVATVRQRLAEHFKDIPEEADTLALAQEEVAVLQRTEQAGSARKQVLETLSDLSESFAAVAAQRAVDA